MKVKKFSVADIAKLANLPLNAKDSKSLEQQLGVSLDFVSKLSEVKTTHVEATNQVTGLSNIVREDIITPSFSQEEALKNASRVHNGFFVVDAVFT